MRNYRQKKGYLSLAIVGGGAILVIGALVLILLTFRQSEQSQYLHHWNQSDYREVLHLARKTLSRDPLDQEALFFSGIAYFYEAVSQTSLQEKMLYLDGALVALRRLHSFYPDHRIGPTEYMLGKVYLERGFYFSDLAVVHLQNSLKAGYVNLDTYEYLARALSLLKRYKKSVLYYKKALEQGETALLFLSLADDLQKLDQLDEALLYYRKSLKVAVDPASRERGLLQLASIHYDTGEYEKARDYFKELVLLKPNDPEAFFMLGETHLALKEFKLARRAWGKAVRLNPKHRRALRRLYG